MVLRIFCHESVYLLNQGIDVSVQQFCHGVAGHRFVHPSDFFEVAPQSLLSCSGLNQGLFRVFTCPYVVPDRTGVFSIRHVVALSIPNSSAAGAVAPVKMTLQSLSSADLSGKGVLPISGYSSGVAVEIRLEGPKCCAQTGLYKSLAVERLEDESITNSLCSTLIWLCCFCPPANQQLYQPTQ